MGWDMAPVGKNPIAEIAKGVVPAVGQWLAEQAELYLDDAWGDEDWESRYDNREGEWVGRDTTGELEKTFILTEYVPPWRSWDAYPESAIVPKYQHYLGRDFKSTRYSPRG